MNKKFTYFVGLCLGLALSITSAMALLVPNGNFAEWGKRSQELIISLGGSEYDAPNAPWDCTNAFKEGAVTKAEGRTPGSTAALLESKSAGFGIFGLEDYVIKTAILSTDDFVAKVLDSPRDQGVECTAILRYLVFWYKYIL